MEGIIDLIRARRRDMRPAEKRVADVVLAKPEGATRYSTAKMAAKAGVSEPTIIRFCRALGCTGFPDFKLRLAGELAALEAAGELELQVDDRTAAYTSKVIDAARGGLGRFLQTVNHGDIEQIVESLIAAKRIHFLGLGASGPVAMDASYKFLKLNSAVQAYTDEWSQRMATTQLAPGDVVVLISYTGRTITMVNVARLAQEAGAVTVALTKADSPLAEAADLCLGVEAPEETQAFLPRHSRIVHFAAVEVLAAGYSLAKGPEFRSRLQKIQQSLEETRLPPAKKNSKKN